AAYADVDQILAVAEGAGDLAEAVRSYLAKAPNEGSLAMALDRMRHRLELAEAPVAEAVADAIVESAQTIPDRDSAFQADPGARARVLLYAVANRLGNPQEALDRWIRTCPNGDFISSLMFFLLRADRNRVFRRWTELDTKTLQRTFADRVIAEPDLI